GGDADRVEALHAGEDGADLVGFHVPLGRQRRHDVLEAGAKVAVVAHGVDQRHGDRVVALGEVRQIGLPEQVLAQAAAFVALVVVGVAIVVGVAGAVAGGAVV